MQLETYQQRKLSADAMFETASLSRKEISMRLKTFGKTNKPSDMNKSSISEKKNDNNNNRKFKNKHNASHHKNVDDIDSYDSIQVGDDDY